VRSGDASRGEVDPGGIRALCCPPGWPSAMLRSVPAMSSRARSAATRVLSSQLGGEALHSGSTRWRVCEADGGRRVAKRRAGSSGSRDPRSCAMARMRLQRVGERRPWTGGRPTWLGVAQACRAAQTGSLSHTPRKTSARLEFRLVSCLPTSPQIEATAGFYGAGSQAERQRKA
jgi:hypothetical protein